MVPMVMAVTGVTVSRIVASVASVAVTVSVPIPVAVDHAKARHREEPD